ncbi:unnamed protein product [Amoebophrya sp. A25]|nr:unnamed protein product [Amoebophrya sp. A25]|eukprot:GSA25T00007978001.1
MPHSLRVTDREEAVAAAAPNEDMLGTNVKMKTADEGDAAGPAGAGLSDFGMIQLLEDPRVNKKTPPSITPALQERLDELPGDVAVVFTCQPRSTTSSPTKGKSSLPLMKAHKDVERVIVLCSQELAFSRTTHNGSSSTGSGSSAGGVDDLQEQRVLNSEVLDGEKSTLSSCCNVSSTFPYWKGVKLGRIRKKRGGSSIKKHQLDEQLRNSSTEMKQVYFPPSLDRGDFAALRALVEETATVGCVPGMHISPRGGTGRGILMQHDRETKIAVDSRFDYYGGGALPTVQAPPPRKKRTKSKIKILPPVRQEHKDRQCHCRSRCSVIAGVQRRSRCTVIASSKNDIKGAASSNDRKGTAGGASTSTSSSSSGVEESSKQEQKNEQEKREGHEQTATEYEQEDPSSSATSSEDDEDDEAEVVDEEDEDETDESSEETSKQQVFPASKRRKVQLQEDHDESSTSSEDIVELDENEESGGDASSVVIEDQDLLVADTSTRTSCSNGGTTTKGAGRTSRYEGLPASSTSSTSSSRGITTNGAKNNKVFLPLPFLDAGHDRNNHPGRRIELYMREHIPFQFLPDAVRSALVECLGGMKKVKDPDAQELQASTGVEETLQVKEGVEVPGHRQISYLADPLVETRISRSFTDKKNTLILLDWDDTLLPSAWVVKHKIVPDPKFNLLPSERLHLEELSAAVVTTLRILKSLGKVVLITNAEAGWIRLSAAALMPAVKDELNDIEQISARSRYETPGRRSPVDWKRLTFFDEVTAFYEYDGEDDDDLEEDYSQRGGRGDGKQQETDAVDSASCGSGRAVREKRACSSSASISRRSADEENQNHSTNKNRNGEQVKSQSKVDSTSSASRRSSSADAHYRSIGSSGGRDNSPSCSKSSTSSSNNGKVGKNIRSTAHKHDPHEEDDELNRVASSPNNGKRLSLRGKLDIPVEDLDRLSQDVLVAKYMRVASKDVDSEDALQFVDAVEEEVAQLVAARQELLLRRRLRRQQEKGGEYRNVISIGDSSHEREAAIEVCRRLDISVVKTLKLTERPHPKQLRRQHLFLHDFLAQCVLSERSLDLAIGRDDAPMLMGAWSSDMLRDGGWKSPRGRKSVQHQNRLEQWHKEKGVRKSAAK